MADFVYVFDLDDTLYLERDYVRSGFAAVGRYLEVRFGVPDAGDYAWGLFESGVRRTTFDDVVAHFDLDSDLVPTLIAQYRDHVPDITMLPDAVNFLSALPSEVTATAMITDGYAAAQRKKIEALGLNPRIDHFMVTGEHGPGWTKPNHAPFEWVEHRCGSAATTYVYFGDNPAKDFHAPRARGWMTVRIHRPAGIYAHLDHNAKVDQVVGSFDELKGVLPG